VRKLTQTTYGEMAEGISVVRAAFELMRRVSGGAAVAQGN
jgi:hypothetical protein